MSPMCLSRKAPELISSRSFLAASSPTTSARRPLSPRLSPPHTLLQSCQTRVSDQSRIRDRRTPRRIRPPSTLNLASSRGKRKQRHRRLKNQYHPARRADIETKETGPYRAWAEDGLR